MTKVKIRELKDAIKSMDIPSEISTSFNELSINIKTYLPILDKITFADTVYKSSVNTDNGLHIINENAFEIAFVNLLVETYSNLSLPQKKDDEGRLELDSITSYNLLCESGLYDIVYNAIPVRELATLKRVVDNHIQAKQDEYDQKNAIQYIIKDGLNKLIEKTPNEIELKELIANAKEEFSNLDVDKMNFLKAAIDWNNGVEK